MGTSETALAALAFWARRWPTKTAIQSDETALSWHELDRRTDALAAGMASRGVRHGDVVGILMRNRVEFVEVLLGAFKAGAAVALLNLRFTAREMIYPVQDSGARLIVADEDLVSKLELVADAKSIYVRGGGSDGNRLDDLRDTESKVPGINLDSEDVALICYTSGTTGTPKGAALSHRNLYAAATIRCLTLGQSYRDRFLVPAPLAYTGGCVSVFRDGIIPGATIYLTSDTKPETFLELIGNEHITGIVAVPILWENMLNHPHFAKTDVSSLRIASTGGALVSPPLMRGWNARGVRITQGYGLTEATGSDVTYVFAEEAEERAGSVGRPMMHMDVRLVDPLGHEVPTGESGEILVSGPAVMKGYWNRPDETREAIQDGWLHTGDVGRRDEEGYMWLVDRVKDMLISGGINVYPAEIERALSTVPGMSDFAVIGLPDTRWGEVPAIVTSSPGTIDLDELKRVCSTELADYKRPRYLVSHDGPLPRTLSGKIQKPELQRCYPEVPANSRQLDKR